MELYTDTYYIQRIQAGDTACFACLLDKYSRPVHSFNPKGGQKPGRCGGTGTGCVYEGVQAPLVVQRGMQFLHVDLPDRLQYSHLGNTEKETRVSGESRNRLFNNVSEQEVAKH